MDVIEFGELRPAQRTELEGDELDPFESARLATPLVWRPKDRHVALCAEDGKLVASVGLVLAEVAIGDRSVIPVIGIGGVIVAASHRGQGLSTRVITEALNRATELGPSVALLFCHRDRVGLYARHGFFELPPPVRVQQPSGLIEMPMVSMWRPLRAGANLDRGPVTLRGLPF